MRETIEKISRVCGEIVAERGDLALFGLFLRDDAPDRWDLVVAAPWVDPAKRESFDYIVAKLRQTLNEDELIKLSRIVFAPLNAPVVERITMGIQVPSPGVSEIVNSSFNGMLIKHAYLFCAQRLPAVASPTVPASKQSP